jgi:AcrR family transcriptional regulator
VARPKSEDKRNAILNAATRLFAERGLATPTSEISKRAGVAEGTLFKYFETKDELINHLYRGIKLELAHAMMWDFPRKESLRTRMQHVWDRYVNWGVAHSEQRKVLPQLLVSETLTKESREAGSAPFAEIQAMTGDAIRRRVLRPGRSPRGTYVEVVRSSGRGDGWILWRNTQARRRNIAIADFQCIGPA